MGEQVGARLISKAGSLIKLAKYPASTIQILGAEKALFRALKSKGKCNTPKYGLIYNSSYIMKAKDKNKGRISRYLANKAAMAVRLDCFLDVPTNLYGMAFRQQVEERLSFFKDGKVPEKNIDVMTKVRMQRDIDASDDEEDNEDVDMVKTQDIDLEIDSLEIDEEKKDKKKKKKDKKKKDKKRKKEEMEVDDEEETAPPSKKVKVETDEEDKKTKKKKKKKDKKSSKKKKKKKSAE